MESKKCDWEFYKGKIMDLNRTFLVFSDGSFKKFKNLRWILDHWKWIKSFEWTTYKNCRYISGMLKANLENGHRFFSEFADFSVAMNFLDRRIFRSLFVSIDGTNYQIQKNFYKEII